ESRKVRPRPDGTMGPMTGLEQALSEAGGLTAPPGRLAQLRTALRAALAHGAAELERTRSGTRERPVEVAVAAEPGRLIAVAPVRPELRADSAAAPGRAWPLVAGLVAALADVAELPSPAAPADLVLLAGRHENRLALALPAREPVPDPELAALAFEDHVEGVDRLRA